MIWARNNRQVGKGHLCLHSNLAITEADHNHHLNFDDEPREFRTLSNGSASLPKEVLWRIASASDCDLAYIGMCKVIRIEGSDFRIEVKQAQYQF
jgi:hypothetical protein